MKNINLHTETERDLYIVSLAHCAAKGKVAAIEVIDNVRSLARRELLFPLSSEDESLLTDYLESLPVIETVDASNENLEIKEIATILKSAIGGGSEFRDMIRRSVFSKSRIGAA